MRLATPQKWAERRREILHEQTTTRTARPQRLAAITPSRTLDSRRIVTPTLNPSLQLLESHFLPSSALLFFINTLQLPDFQWLSSDLRWPPYRGWQYNKRNGVMKSRNSISTLLAIHIPAGAGGGFIICYPLSLLSWELAYCVCMCVCAHACTH